MSIFKLAKPIRAPAVAAAVDVSAVFDFPSAPAPAPSAAYRDGQAYLLQPVPAPLATTLGGDTYDFENEGSSLWGPSRTHVSRSNYSGWLWDNAGGDWIDSAEVRMGTTHWATQAVSAVGGTPVTHAINITSALQYVQTEDRWNAWIVSRASGTNYRYLAGRTNGTEAYRPRIEVTYADATTATLACRVSARLNSGTPSQLSATMVLSTSAGTGEMALEFDRPTKAVSAATLYITVTEDGGGSGTLRFNLADPPRNTEPVTGADGLASTYGALDEDLDTDPNIIGVHRYVDGVVYSDFFAPDNALNYNAESAYDPAIYGTGSEDLAKLPHAYAGKWIDSNQDEGLITVVDSSYSDDGFEPLYAGLGAVRVVMPDTGVTTGDEQSNGGTTAVARKLMMPPAEYGLLDRIFVRYYLRLGTPYAPGVSDIKEILRFGSPEWTAMAGKWGIAPEHVTSYGGFSGSSGGRMGWQLRHKWCDGPADLSSSPPDGGSIHSGWHLYDFNTNNPVGYRYASESVYLEGWGQIGGYGSTFYPGRWYCIEQEVKLNSVDAPSGTGDGLDWTPDGELRVWVDGRLTYERTGMVFRALPLYDPGYSASQLRPVREIGVKALLWNFYHGGLNNSTYQRVHFVTGLAWGKQRIGPMHDTPAVQITGNEWTPNVDGSGNVLASDFAQLPLMTTLKIVTNKLDDVVPTPRYGIKNGATDGSVSIVRGWSGAAVDHVNERMYISGGGHADSHICENGIYSFDALKLTFAVALPRSDDADGQWYDSGAGNFVALTGPTDTHNDSIGSPMADGHFPASHTFWSIEYITAADFGNTAGAFLSFFGTKQLVDLDDGSLSVPHWTSPGDNVDFSYAFVVADWPRAVMLYGDFYGRAWAFDDTTSTTWTTETGSGESLGAILYPAASSSSGGFTHGARLVRNQKAVLRIPERREVVILAVQSEVAAGVFHRRLRYGEAFDNTATFSAGTSWASYIDTLTLTSSDDSHLDFETQSKFADVSYPTVPRDLFAAGCVWDDETDTAWLWGNGTGSDLYKLTGLAAGNTVTTERMASTARPLTHSYNGTFGRCMLVSRGGAKCLVRVSATTNYAEIVRVE